MKHKTRRMGLPAAALLLSGLAASFAATAGVYTTDESTTNPDYAGFQLSTVVIDVRAGDPEASIVFGQRLAKELKKRGVAAYVQRDLFPASHDWDNYPEKRVFESLAIETIILIDIAEQESRETAKLHTTNYTSSLRGDDHAMPGSSDAPSSRYGRRQGQAAGSGATITTALRTRA